MNYGQQIEIRMQKLLRELDKVAQASEFEDEDLYRFIRDAAALWERTLMKCSLVQKPQDTKLFNLINVLEFNGVDESLRIALHDLRLEANKGKHDANPTLTYSAAYALIEKPIAVLLQLQNAGVLELNNPPAFKQRRSYFIDRFDNYAHGDVVFNIYLQIAKPVHGKFTSPQSVENFSVRFSDEDAVIGQLRMRGGLAEVSSDETPDYQYEDYMGRWRWEGTHRDLVLSFAAFQLHAELLPGLSRADHLPSVFSAAAMAMVDVAKPADWKDLLWKMSADFGIWRRGTRAEQVAKDAVSLFDGLISKELYGPRWLERSQAEASLTSTKFITTDGFLLGIDDNNTVVIGMDLTDRGYTLSIMRDEDLLRPNDPLVQ